MYISYTLLKNLWNKTKFRYKVLISIKNRNVWDKIVLASDQTISFTKIIENKKNSNTVVKYYINSRNFDTE